MKKEIKIPTKEDKFFRIYLESIKIFKPFRDLRPRELDVLAELLYRNHLLRDIPIQHRWKIIFNYDSKVEMRDKLGMKDVTYNNLLSCLRNKGFIINNTIPNGYLISPDKENYLIFKYEIS